MIEAVREGCKNTDNKISVLFIQMSMACSPATSVVYSAQHNSRVYSTDLALIFDEINLYAAADENRLNLIHRDAMEIVA